MKPEDFPGWHLANTQEGRATSWRLVIDACGPEAAADLHRLTQLAFASYSWLDPPSGALRETEADVRGDLDTGGALASLDSRVVGGLRFKAHENYLHVRRVAVDPEYQRHGIGRAVMEWVHRYALQHDLREVRVGVRSQLPGNLVFYERLGYQIIRAHSHPGYREVTWYELSLAL